VKVEEVQWFWGRFKGLKNGDRMMTDVVGSMEREREREAGSEGPG